jgi:uncharacterized protein involved in outer membrane biogenesis
MTVALPFHDHARPDRAQASAVRYIARNAALGLLVALPVAVALFFEWDVLIPLVERYASASLGRPVHIGHLRVELAQRPRIVAERITLANPDDFPADSTMASIDRLAVRLDVMKLLKGEIDLPEIVVDRPVARLEPGKSGRRNWQGLGGSKSAAASEPGAPPRIGQLIINDGAVRLKDPRLKADLDLKLRTAPGAKGGPPRVLVEGKGSYAGAPTKIAGEAGSLLSLQESHVRYPVNFRWDVGPTHIKLNGTVDDPLRFNGLQGTLEMTGPDLAQLYPLTGIPIPPSPPYALNGRVAFANNVVRFHDFHGTLGSSDLNGDLKVDISSDKPRLEGDLSSQRIAFADLAGFVGGTPGKPDAPNATAERKAAAAADKANPKSLPDTPISLEKLNAMDARVRYHGRQVQADYLPLDDLAAELDLQNGRLRMRPLSFGIGQGTIKLMLDIDGRAKPVRVDADAEFRNLDLKRVMAQTKVFEGAGTVGGRVRLRGTGQSVAQVVASGDGGLTVVMSGGEISALLIELAGMDVVESLGFATGIKRKPENTHNIRCMVVDGDLKQGVLATKTLVFDTTDTNIDGKASIDFHNEGLTARVVPHPKDMSILTFRTPINVKGTLKHPTITPDPIWTGGRIAASVLLGVLATPLAALIPTIDLGLGEDSDCGALIADARAAAAPPAQAAAKPVAKPAQSAR